MLVIGANDLDGNEIDHIIMQYKDLVKSVWEIQPGYVKLKPTE